MMAFAAWTTRPDTRAWGAMLALRAVRWHTDAALVVDRDRIVSEVAYAAASTAPSWLAHPCMNTLTLDSPENRYERDVLFVTWAATHATAPLGDMTLPRAAWRWSPQEGAVRVEAGVHNLAQLIEHDRSATERSDAPVPKFAIDVHCRSIGFPLPRAWAEPEEGCVLSPLAAMATRELSHALDAFVARLPACAAWASAVTKVVVPLQHERLERSSGSEPDIPGLIHVAGLHGPVSAVEGLVHESAHHHFTMAEAAGAFVDPTHRALYASPLRSEPRPLARVLLAVHALWHLVRFYEDAIASGLVGLEWSDRQRQLEQQLVAGLVTLAEAAPHFTPSGLALLSQLTERAVITG